MREITLASTLKSKDNRIDWKKMWYFQAYFFYPPVFLYLLINAARAVGWQSLAWTLPLGMGLWMFIEYILHRYVFHHEEKGQWWALLPWAHRTHHKHPRELSLIFAPVWFSLPISIVVWLALRLTIGNGYLAVLILIGIWSAYLWYEFVHYSAHCRQPKTKLMRYLKTYHLLHHHTSDPIWFGVTSPYIDHLFKTYRALPGRKSK